MLHLSGQQSAFVGCVEKPVISCESSENVIERSISKDICICDDGQYEYKHKKKYKLLTISFANKHLPQTALRYPRHKISYTHTSARQGSYDRKYSSGLTEECANSNLPRGMTFPCPKALRYTR
jgi:hypothetical protein